MMPNCVVRSSSVTMAEVQPRPKIKSPSLRCCWDRIQVFGASVPVHPRAAGMAELSPCRLDGLLGMAARCPLMARPLIENCDIDRWVRTGRRGHRQGEGG